MTSAEAMGVCVTEVNLGPWSERSDKLSGYVKGGEFLTSEAIIKFLGRTLLHGVKAVSIVNLHTKCIQILILRHIMSAVDTGL
jgi:hypothetical protein